jgi:hypothetical protein
MNRRNFIKSATIAATIPAIAITCKYEDDEKGPEKESMWKNWDYRVYCYEREQGNWIFSENTRGSFAHQREYMTFEEDKGWPYAGWMDGGKLHFASLDDATDFVDLHVRTKEDTNLIDSIYNIYYVSRELDEKETGSGEYKETEIQVGHYWFNGDTGRQVHWVAESKERPLSHRPGCCTNWQKVEFS